MWIPFHCHHHRRRLSIIQSPLRGLPLLFSDESFVGDWKDGSKWLCEIEWTTINVSLKMEFGERSRRDQRLLWRTILHVSRRLPTPSNSPLSLVRTLALLEYMYHRSRGHYLYLYWFHHLSEHLIRHRLLISQKPIKTIQNGFLGHKT